MKFSKMPKISRLLVSLAAIALASCTFNDPEQTRSGETDTTAQQPTSASDRECTLVEQDFGASGTINVRAQEVVSGLEVPYHNGSRIRFGRDGMLYIGTGDAREPELSQNIAMGEELARQSRIKFYGLFVERGKISEENCYF